MKAEQLEGEQKEVMEMIHTLRTAVSGSLTTHPLLRRERRERQERRRELKLAKGSEGGTNHRLTWNYKGTDI